jgi:4,5-dihydroxyphthalate decarboxylase
MKATASDRRLDIAFWNYDRTTKLADGSVKIPGVVASFHSGRIVTEIFESMVRLQAYDVSELGMTYFLRTFNADGKSPFLAIPVFPVRSFRHGAIYINRKSGIKEPKDLAGKRIGELALYGHDAGIMPKGILSDEFGVKPEQCRWIIGKIDFPLKPVDYVTRPVPDGVEIEWAGADVDLGEMLENGEIDALISADAPKCVLAKSPKVGRLFENYVEMERDYFRRTGIFPIMHGVVVKRELAEEHPDAVKAIYDAFCEAKDQMEQMYVKGMTFNNMNLMHPWLSALIGENRDLLGEDWWPYGISANRKAIDVILRYHYEQGLTKRRFALEDIFAACVLET